MAGKSILKIIIGIGAIVLGVVLSVVFFSAFITLTLGVLGPFLIFVGLVMVAIAKE